jgi:hypothetical protein
VFLSAFGEGTIALLVPPGPAADGWSPAPTSLVLSGVWYCPECPFQLISTKRLVEAGHSIQLTLGGATILTKAGQPALWLPMDGAGLYSCTPVDAPHQVAGVVGAADNQLPGVEGGTLPPGMGMM